MTLTRLPLANLHVEIVIISLLLPLMDYDYIILGGGASGLSLAHRMSEHGYFDDKKIAIIEQSPKVENDRTWSFWEDEAGPYESILHKKWSQLEFHSSTLSKHLDISPYVYKMIRGIDFYNYTYGKLADAPHIKQIFEPITSIDEHTDSVTVQTASQKLTAKHVFKSYPSVDIDKEKHIYVAQHFKGFFIETEVDSFDPDKAVFMDFRIDQKGEARFLYVLPESKRKALVEVAIFSNNILSQKEYDTILTDYIEQYMDVDSYSISEEEFGVIPMTTYPFHHHNTKNITHIGTGGGIVKSSSGYAFRRIQQHSDQLLDCIVNQKPMSKSYEGLMGRYSMYDKTMLSAMLKGGISGDRIFSDLFGKKRASKILKFLNHETSFVEELDIFTAPPWWPFTKAFFRELV